MSSPPFSIGAFPLWAWQWLTFLATTRRCTATRTIGCWAPYDKAQGESKESNRLVVHCAPQKQMLKPVKAIWGEGKRMHDTLRLKQMGPEQKNQKGCPGKPGMWLLSHLKAKTLTEEEDGPHLRQTTCSERDMAQRCSQPLGPKVPPSYPLLRGRVLSERLGSRRSVAWISRSNGKTKDYRTCAVKST